MSGRPKVSALTFGRMVGLLAQQFEVVPELMAADCQEEPHYRVAVKPEPASFAPKVFAPGLTPTPDVVQCKYREFRRVPGEFLGVQFKFWEELP